MATAKEARQAATSGKPAAARPTSHWKQAFRRRLLAWYRRNARDLEWRNSRDPYRIWVSEIMLQQTQVATVADYFTRFLTAFPNVEALAAAPEEQVLRLWEGLGYYRRARQMHRAAKAIVNEHGGHFPRELETVLALPGIGRYTAGAITSIAFDAAAPILEANTVRLFSRLLAYRGDPRQSHGQQILWAFAEDLLPRQGSGELNQALMELGSLVCTPRKPACERCPAMSLCPTHRDKLQDFVPLAPRKPNVEHVREAALVVRRRRRVLLMRRGEGGRWAGLWDFPRFGLSAAEGDALDRELAAKLRELTGVVARPRERIATLRHGVTRFRIALDCYAADYVSAAKRLPDGAELRWVSPSDFESYPLSVTGRKLSRLAAAERAS
ncbi:MAG TPA: A/G-specific adenine glycosylase [Pirellulales bacterium]|nr:A/G-specific adenine glycosylase [Pirellulales bacterium]